MKLYKAIVRDGERSVFIESEYNTKQEFIKELRGNGYKVDPSRVKDAIEFDRIMNTTNGEDWDWQPRKYK